MLSFFTLYPKIVIMTNANGTNMKLLIQTQYSENYGTPDEPYWKMKGGEDYIIDVPGFRFYEDMAYKKAEMIVDELRSKIECSCSMSEEYIRDWSFVEDDFMTDYEKSQLEFEGEVLYPAKRMSYDELMESSNV